MKKVSVCDIEATQWINFACIGFFDGEEYEVFWSIEGFIDKFLSKKYKGYICYAHFGGRYDFRFIIPPLIDSGKYDLFFIERGSKILSIKIREKKTKMTWTLLDSYFLLPMSLKELGKNFQIKYMKLGFDVETCTKAEHFNTPEAQLYLRNDCLGLYEILEKFSNWGLNNGKLKRTLPSQSLHVFTTQFLKTKLLSLSDDQEEFVRRCYFGGRVEIFKMYGQDLNYYDVNSEYPRVMCEDMPTGRAVNVCQYYPDKIGFYEVEADVPNLLIPPLPVVINKKLFFPTGRGTFFSNTAELELLKELGGTFRVKRGVIFEKREPIFKEYVLAMWQIRQSFPSGTMENLIAKLLSNSLYGKTGQKRTNTELIFSTEPQVGLTPFDEEFGLYTREKQSRSQYILPYLSAYVTALARVYLFRYFQKVGFENVYYCDTDSIITSKTLPTGKNLGELKLEQRIKEGCFLQPKAYAFSTIDGQEVVKVKGMREIQLSTADFIKAQKSGDLRSIKSEYKMLMGFRESLRRKRTLEMTRISVTKNMRNSYDKRSIKNELTFPFEYSTIISVK